MYKSNVDYLVEQFDTLKLLSFFTFAFCHPFQLRIWHVCKISSDNSYVYTHSSFVLAVSHFGDSKMASRFNSLILSSQ